MVQYIDATTGTEGTVDLERDRAWVLRCQAGDSAAFAALYTRYEARLLRFCLRRVHDRQEAEDLTQEAFVRAWRALPRFAGDRRFYPWITVIAGNLCTDALRRRTRTDRDIDVELERIDLRSVDRQPTTEEQVDAAVDGELVHRALDRLSDRHRRVLELREGSEWSYKEIARFEGVEVSAVETLVWRARRALKREFEVVSGATTSLGGFLVGGAGITRRWRALVARHGGNLHPGGLRLRDAALALVVTSAVATSAAIPSSAPLSAGTSPSVVDPAGAPLRTAPAGHASAGGSDRSASRGRGGAGDHVNLSSTNGTAAATGVMATGVTGGGGLGVRHGSTPVPATGSANSAAAPVSLSGAPVAVIPPGVVLPVVSAARAVTTSAVASLGIFAPVPGTGAVSGSGPANPLPGATGAVAGTLTPVVTTPRTPSAPSIGPVGGVLGIP